MDGFQTLKHILSFPKTPACKLTKFLVVTVSPIFIYENTVDDSFHLPNETLEQDSSLFMGSFDLK